VAGTETVVFQRAPARRDAQGAETLQRQWENATSSSYEGCTVQPLSSTEAWAASGVGVTESLVVFGPRGVDMDVRAGDRALWSGKTLEVDGEPERWPTPRGGVHHWEIRLRSQPPTPGDATEVATAIRAGIAGLVEASTTWTPTP
jgi:hypothetical protein